MKNGAKKIKDLKHRELIDRAIEQGYSPSLIREGLVRQGIDQYTMSEIEDYTKAYYQNVLHKSVEEYADLSDALSNSIPIVLMDQTEFDKKLSYQALLELDILRSEKLIQDMMAGKPTTINIDTFAKLAKIKQSVIQSVSTFIQYKQAITQAKNVQQTAKMVNMERLGPYLQNLSPPEKSVVLDVLNIVMESQNDQLVELDLNDH